MAGVAGETAGKLRVDGPVRRSLDSTSGCAESHAGLTTEEARRRLSSVGPNRLVEPRPWARARAVLEAVLDPMAFMLAAAAAVHLALGQVRDGVVLLVSLVPVLGVDVLLRARSRAALARLADRVAPPALVVRDGRPVQVTTEDVVPGDLLVMREGAVLHADGRVVDASNLSVDESPLTGESLPQGKRADAGTAEEEGRFFAGTVVLGGQGLGVVEETGARTRFGRIGRLTAEAAGVATPLQQRVSRAVRAFALPAGILSLVVAALAWARGASAGAALLQGLTFAVAAVPEEFPIVYTLFLSVGAWRLARHGVLTRRLACVEALGSTTVVCVDKTGTLTRGRFSLTEHRAAGGAANEARLLEAAVLACEPDPHDPLERAIVAHAAEHGASAEGLHARWTLVRDHDFDPRSRHMSHVWRDASEEWVVAKGALEGILDHCAADAATRASAERLMAESGSRGIRVLAVAGRRGPALAGSGRREEDERELTLYGLLGFDDPVRPEVARAVAACRAAGIAVVVVTGDHALTASAVAAAAGVAEAGAPVLTGADLDGLSEARLPAVLATTRVLARVRPDQKTRVVEALRAAGEVVAMTGDGINDAPALRRADVGVSMGPGAAEVARESAGLVLLENDFRGFVAAVREGRAIFANLQRSFLYLISFHVPVLALATAVPAVGWPALLLPIHLVWLELIVHPVSALAFEGDAPTDDVMTLPPRPRATPMLARADVLRAAVTGLAVAAAAFLRYAVALPRGVDHARAAALAVTFVGAALSVCAERAIGAPWWRVRWPRRTRFWIVLLLAPLGLVALSAVPATALALGIVPLSAADWCLSALLGAAAVLWRAPGRRRRSEAAP
jgi:Ca2+-transporting ATPase